MSELMFLALLPGVLIIIYIFKRDKVEKEPVPLIVKMIILGAVSCAPAAFLEGIMDGILPQFSYGSLPYAVTTAFFSAGLIEECCKFAFLKVGIWRNREFDYRFDGIVYGVSTAIGFACLENVLYVMDGGISVAVTRAFLAVPLHAFCGVFMGAFFGAAKYHYTRGNRSRASALQVQGVVTAIIVHGIYDTFAMWNSQFSTALLLGFTVIVYIAGIKTINRLEKDDYMMSFYNTGEVYEYVPSYSDASLKNTDGMSIAALVCAIVSALTSGVFIIPSLLAVVLGIAGIRRGGGTAAKAAVIIGGIMLLGGGYFVGGALFY